MTKQIDAATRSYLNIIRQKNKAVASKCYKCGAESMGINADKHTILYVCKDHYIQKDDLILDTSQPGVIHYTYPNGKKVAENMMDPNIGGWKKNQDIWATQSSFEE
jgi:hypothetical protein